MGFDIERKGSVKPSASVIGLWHKCVSESEEVFGGGSFEVADSKRILLKRVSLLIFSLSTLFFFSFFSDVTSSGLLKTKIERSD